MRSPEALVERFREDGLKVTPQRQAVFSALHGDLTHPTAEVIWDRVRLQMPTVSRRTVYQVLNDLVSLGEVQIVAVDNGPTRFDPNVELHDHFVCSTCARVIDVGVRERANDLDRPTVLSDCPGFEVQSVEVVFRGQCAACTPLGTTATNLDAKNTPQK